MEDGQAKSRLAALIKKTLLILTALLCVQLFHPKPAQASPLHEFIMSCTYGVLAGTLVGAATLAFTDQPSENLNRVARGASWGLYTGILLGLYVVYVVPNQQLDQDVLPPGQESRFQLIPLWDQQQQKLEGVRAQWLVTRF